MCIITGTDTRQHRGFKISSGGAAGAVAVFNLSITHGRGRAVKRRVRRAAEAIRHMGAAICAAEDGFLYADMLRAYGVELATVRRLESEKLAEMALLFTEDAGYSAEKTRFILRRGGFETMLNAAVRLSRVSRHIVFDCISGADIADALLARTGAVARLLENTAPVQENDVSVAFSEEEGAVLRSGKRCATLSDFEVLLPAEFGSIIPQNCAASSAAALITCGFLCADEIKTVLRCAEK